MFDSLFRKIKQPPTALVWPLLSLTWIGSASAEPLKALDRMSMSLGAFYAKTDADLNLGNNTGSLSTGPFQLFNGHDLFPRARAEFLIGESQGIAIDYYGFRKSRDGYANQDFSFNGTDYSANANLTGSSRLDIGNLSYRWWFGGEQSAFGVGLGAAYYRLRVELNGYADVNGQIATSSDSYNDHAIAPLLTLGWRQVLTDTTRIYVDASAVKKNGGSLSGHIYNAALGAEWFPMQNLGVGLEYGESRIRLDKHADNYQANLDLRFRGPSLFVKLKY